VAWEDFTAAEWLRAAVSSACAFKVADLSFPLDPFCFAHLVAEDGRRRKLMINRPKNRARLLNGALAALVCVFAVPCGDAVQPLTVLDARETSRLVLKQDPPDYPVVAKLNYIEGLVHAELVVSPTGEVARAHVVDGNPLFAEALFSVVPQWRYRPLVANGRRTPFLTVVEIKFSLHYADPASVPPNAESDFSRQVKPPEVLTGPEKPASNDPAVRLRLLIDGEGKVIDSSLLKGSVALFEAAKGIVQKWSFRPARWGALCVPWYLDVDVHVNNAPSRASLRAPDGFEASQTSFPASKTNTSPWLAEGKVRLLDGLNENEE
jgi:hypothetical protein